MFYLPVKFHGEKRTGSILILFSNIAKREKREIFFFFFFLSRLFTKWKILILPLLVT